MSNKSCKLKFQRNWAAQFFTKNDSLLLKNKKQNNVCSKQNNYLVLQAAEGVGAGSKSIKKMFKKWSFGFRRNIAITDILE
jgi:hypothetical protein